MIKAFGEDGASGANWTGSNWGGRGWQRGVSVWSLGWVPPGPEPLLLSSQPLQEETKMNAEVSS